MAVLSIAWKWKNLIKLYPRLLHSPALLPMRTPLLSLHLSSTAGMKVLVDQVRLNYEQLLFLNQINEILNWGATIKSRMTWPSHETRAKLILLRTESGTPTQILVARVIQVTWVVRISSSDCECCMLLLGFDALDWSCLSAITLSCAHEVFSIIYNL